MKQSPLSRKALLRTLLIFSAFVLLYYVVEVAFDVAIQRSGPTLPAGFIAGGILLVLLGLIIAIAELKQRALIKHAPHGQKKPVWVILLPLAALWLYGAGLACFGLSYWWGGGWKLAAAASLVGALILTGAGVLSERRPKRMPES